MSGTAPLMGAAGQRRSWGWELRDSEQEGIRTFFASSKHLVPVEENAHSCQDEKKN
jgi:hypothetical protein